MIALDLSRLLSRAGRGTPTGIDRVELAYAKHLVANRASASFTALSASGGLGLLRRPAAERFVAAIGAAWRGELDPVQQDRQVRQIAWRARIALLASRERVVMDRLRAARAPSIYLLVSHHHLEKRGLIARMKQRSAARFICLIHDLIPIEFPEYVRRGRAATPSAPDRNRGAPSPTR